MSIEDYNPILHYSPDSTSDILCPNCHQGYELEWDTDYYHNPAIGIHCKECKVCHSLLTIDVRITIQVRLNE